jgi:hypothetical protein
MENESEIDIKLLLISLKNLSELKVNEKIYFEDNILKIDQRYLQSIKRSYYNNNRENTINSINSITNNTFDYINKLIENEKNKNLDNNNYFIKSNCESISYINFNLINSCIGLRNLKLTYSNDINIQTKIDLIILEIENNCKKINNLFKLNI